MESRVLVIALAVLLSVSLCLNAILYYQSHIIGSTKDDFVLYYLEFRKIPVQNRNYSLFSPPISMYHALRIALENGGWNATSLENMTVYVSLHYDSFYKNSSFSEFEVIREVTEPVSDYSPVQINATTYRYVWTIIVEHSGGTCSIPPPGYYLVDAATAEKVNIN